MVRTMREELADWLQDKPCTLWGRAYDLYNEESVEQAADWFYRQMTEYMDWVDKRNGR